MKPALTLLALVCPMLAQQAIIVDAGSRTIQPIRVAPGQVLHLRIQNLQTVFDSTQAARTLPLPSAFGQLSVLLRQTGTAPMALPLIRGLGAHDSCAVMMPALPGNLNPLVDCPPSDSRAMDLMVQIPYELKANPSGLIRFEDLGGLSDATLTVRELGREAGGTRILPVEDRIHILTQCSGQLYNDTPCTPLIYHADGKPVDAANPARAGEEIVAYAWGLGKPDQPLVSGAATPETGVPVSRPIRVHFPGTGQPDARARYVGLVPGQVGLYRINLTVPQLPESLQACSETLPSNLTAVIRGTASHDQVSFCARP